MSVETKNDRVDEMVKAVEKLTSKECLVGIPADANARSDDPIGNAALGYIQEFGSPARNIPPRPFLHPGIDKARDKIEAAFRKGAEQAMGGSTKAADVALNTAGLVASASVKNEITSGIFEPLKAQTLAARKRAGFLGEKPLIVTGQLLRSITYVIRDKG